MILGSLGVGQRTKCNTFKTYFLKVVLMKDPHICVYQSLLCKSLINPFQSHPSKDAKIIATVTHESNIFNMFSHGEWKVRC